MPGKAALHDPVLGRNSKIRCHIGASDWCKDPLTTLRKDCARFCTDMATIINQISQPRQRVALIRVIPRDTPSLSWMSAEWTLPAIMCSGALGHDRVRAATWPACPCQSPMDRYFPHFLWADCQCFRLQTLPHDQPAHVTAWRGYGSGSRIMLRVSSVRDARQGRKTTWQLPIMQARGPDKYGNGFTTRRSAHVLEMALPLLPWRHDLIRFLRPHRSNPTKINQLFPVSRSKLRVTLRISS